MRGLKHNIHESEVTQILMFGESSQQQTNLYI